jgi:hypothetical protein
MVILSCDMGSHVKFGRHQSREQHDGIRVPFSARVDEQAHCYRLYCPLDRFSLKRREIAFDM